MIIFFVVLKYNHLYFKNVSTYIFILCSPTDLAYYSYLTINPRAYDSCLEIGLLDIGNADLKAEEKRGFVSLFPSVSLLLGTFSAPIGKSPAGSRLLLFLLCRAHPPPPLTLLTLSPSQQRLSYQDPVIRATGEINQ